MKKMDFDKMLTIIYLEKFNMQKLDVLVKLSTKILDYSIDCSIVQMTNALLFH